MEDKCIQYYDSMGRTDEDKLQGLLEYVKDEYKVKNGGQEMDVSDWALVLCTSDIPQQIMVLIVVHLHVCFVTVSHRAVH